MLRLLFVLTSLVCWANIAAAGPHEDCMTTFTDAGFAPCNESIRINPNDRDAYHYRANLYWNKKDYSHAIADYTRALEIDPSFASGYWMRGRVYDEMGDYAKAVADFTKIFS